MKCTYRVHLECAQQAMQIASRQEHSNSSSQVLQRFRSAMALRMIRSMAYRLSRAPRPQGARPQEPF